MLALGVAMTSCNDDDEKIDGLQATVFEDATGLNLTYSDAPMAGKRVAFTPMGDSKATLVLSGGDFVIDTRDVFQKPSMSVGVIPGEPTTTLNIDLDKRGDAVSFAGRDEKDGRVIEYLGRMDRHNMDLNLHVRMPDNALSGKSFALLPIPEGSNVPEETLPLIIKWTADPFSFNSGMEDMIKMVLVGLPIFDGHTGMELVCSSLGEIGFLKDGNIQASYRGKTTNGEWMSSPLNVAQYVVRGNTIGLYMNFAQLKGQQQSRVQAGALISLLGIVQKMVAEGFPVKFSTDENGMTSFYIDEELLLPMLKAVKPLFEDKEFNAQLLKLILDKVGPELAPMVSGLVGPMLDEMPHIIDTTTEIRLGIRTEEVIK